MSTKSGSMKASVRIFLAIAIFLSVTTVQSPRVRAQATVAPPMATCAAPPCSADAIANLSTVKDQIKAYYLGGSYLAEVRTIEADAQAYLDARVRAGVKKPALVLDIDDTALSTYGYEEAHDFGFDPEPWNTQAIKGFPAIEPTLDLAKHAKAENIAVFFITGRRVPQTDFTRRNLVSVGYPVDGLYLRPLDDHQKTVVPYKSGTRGQIEADGYTVLETIGDQWSDLNGGHAERAFKLPNPMYFIP
jgi:HAD superfamily, subfamily IIIB (Acid phosphatase)